MSGDRYLIVNADDFGRSPGINAGIVECHLSGIVTSTTLMVNLDWAGDAVGQLMSCPRLGVGLHLNFCYGAPVALPHDVPSLIDPQGRFITNTGWLAEHADEGDILVEARAQLERFRQLVGRAPTHLDSHKYLHSRARIRRPVLRLAQSAGLPVRSVTGEDRAATREASVPTTDRFEGRFHGLDGIGVSFDILSAALNDVAPGTTELMCHPGYADAHIQDSSYAADRERELAALCDRRSLAEIERLDIRLMTFAEI